MIERPPSVRLSLQPAEGEAIQVTIRAEYYEGQLDTKLFRAQHPQYQPLSSNPLILEPERQRYVFISRFGAMVFWNCTDEIVREILDACGRLPGSLQRIEQVVDEMTIHIGSGSDTVTFNEVDLRELTLEKMKIISLAFGQSVALDHLELEVARVLKRYEPVVAELHKSGQLILSPKEVMQMIGFSYEVRSAVLANLTLFDSPPETWESEVLAHLDSQLYDYFDLEERVSAINQKLRYLNDLQTMMMDILHQRNSERLEWIVIILIFFEIAFSLAQEFIFPMMLKH